MKYENSIRDIWRIMILYVLNIQIKIMETAVETDNHVNTTRTLNISFENNILTISTEIKVAMTDIKTSSTNTIFVLIYFCAYVCRNWYIFSI